MRSSILIYCLTLVTSLQAASLKVGAEHDYVTIQQALNAAKPGDTILIHAGTYKEKLTVEKDNITLKGDAYPNTSPSANTALLTSSNDGATAANADASATLFVTGSNFKLYNINITNTAGTIQSQTQAVAISFRSVNSGIYTAALKSFSNTVYSHTGSQFFARTYIEGSSDIIFGIRGQAWFQGCTIGILTKGGITAQGRISGDTDGFFVFDQAKLGLGPSALAGTKGSVYLGRPWGDYARVVFQNSNEGNIIAPAGWEPYSPTQSTANTLLAEYANTNAGGLRAALGRSLSSAYSISSILPNYKSWVDGDFLGVGAR